jgi:hypothetical protein
MKEDQDIANVWDALEDSLERCGKHRDAIECHDRDQEHRAQLEREAVTGHVGSAHPALPQRLAARKDQQIFPRHAGDVDNARGV